MSRLFLKFSLFYPPEGEKSKQGKVHAGYAYDENNRACGYRLNLALKTVKRSYITEYRFGVSSVYLLTCKGGAADGLDALLSTVMMPSGIPVATVAVDGGANAALLACQMLALSDEALDAALVAKRCADREAVLEKNAKVEAEFNK